MDHALIDMIGIRGDIKIHDPGEGDHQQDDEKEVKPKAQAPRDRKDFFKQDLMHRVFHLFILRNGPGRRQKYFRQEAVLAYSYYIIC